MDMPAQPRGQVQLDTMVAGPLFMLSAALLFTLVNLLIKLLGPQYTVWHIGFFRFFGGAVVLLAIFGRHRNPFKGNDIRLLIIRGCTGSAAFICAVSAIRMLPVSTALVIFYAYPAFAAIASFLLYGERLTRAEMVCISVVLAGIGVLFGFPKAGSLLGQCMALAGSAFAGLTVTLIKTLRQKNGPVIIYLYFCTMGVFVTLPFFGMHPLIPSDPLQWVMVMGIVLASLTGQLLMNQGFFYCRGWEGGVLMSSEVVFTAVVGIVFLGDPTTLRFWLGGLMIFGSVVALNRFKGHGRSAPVLRTAAPTEGD